MNNCFKNGKKMTDTEGKQICLQFPHIIYHNQKYYLYGTNKEKSDGKQGFWHWGIRMYESDDLYNWKDLGVIIPPDTENEDSPLNPRAMMDAPCIIYNEKTEKWVCWIIRMNVEAYTLTSSSIEGPYKFEGEGFKPCGFPIGDFDLMKDDDGKGYIYFNHPHTEIICAELTDDYTRTKEEYVSLLPHPESVPYNREAPTHFKRDGKHYLFTSGTTAFYPNPSESAVADNPMGPFETIGNPHIGDESMTSFHSQIRSVFKVPHKEDLYIALADRWLPDFMHIPYEKYKEWFLIRFHKSSPEEIDRCVREEREIMGTNDIMKFDISKGQCVFLPITFNDGKPEIYWRDEWSLDEYR